MKAATFSHLSLSNQSNHLWRDGELLAARETDLFVVHLYSVFYFLVEVVFLKKNGRIEVIRIMDPKDGLQEYSDMVDLPAELF
ncbi:MAG TPA: hypothetical protein DCE41_07530 [Cytophagales bacterium]|nr:hypothetical protein [Cytophagales bacterium]HAA23039.1 hypothetical protein [Cytophagales bacterium]HAP62084.1 hypothetical protein [Cytophagales bacterium]